MHCSTLIRQSVEDYLLKSATLRLKHNYPVSNPPKIARVNIQHVLESVQRTEIDVGSWINVIGYVERQKPQGIHIQALAVWEAGNVDLDAYQKAYEGRKEAARIGEVPKS